MELNIKQIMESEAYERNKIIINNEINYGDPTKNYLPNRKEFEHLILEPDQTREAKKKWRNQCIQHWGTTWTKRSASRRHGEFHNRMN